MQTKTQSRIEKVAGAYYLIVEALAKDINTGEWVVVESQEPQKLTNADGGNMTKEQVLSMLGDTRTQKLEQQAKELAEIDDLLNSISD